MTIRLDLDLWPWVQFRNLAPSALIEEFNFHLEALRLSALRSFQFHITAGMKNVAKLVAAVVILVVVIIWVNELESNRRALHRQISNMRSLLHQSQSRQNQTITENLELRESHLGLRESNLQLKESRSKLQQELETLRLAEAQRKLEPPKTTRADKPLCHEAVDKPYFKMLWPSDMVRRHDGLRRPFGS